MKKCLNCGKNKAVKVAMIGYTYCKACIVRQKAVTVGDAVEITTLAVKESRKAYAKDILQKYTGDNANLDYIKEYGTKGFTKEELKTAKPEETKYYKDKFEKVKI